MGRIGLLDSDYDMSVAWQILINGNYEDNLDGQVKVPLANPMNYVILKESEDERIGKLGTLKAINKIIKAIESNKIKEKMSCQS